MGWEYRSTKIGLVGLKVNPGGILITPDGKVCTKLIGYFYRQ